MKKEGSKKFLEPSAQLLIIDERHLYAVISKMCKIFAIFLGPHVYLHLLTFLSVVVRKNSGCSSPHETKIFGNLNIDGEKVTMQALPFFGSPRRYWRTPDRYMRSTMYHFLLPELAKFSIKIRPKSTPLERSPWWREILLSKFTREFRSSDFIFRHPSTHNATFALVIRCRMLKGKALDESTGLEIQFSFVRFLGAAFSALSR